MSWFYAKDGKQEGPVDLAALQAKLQSGELAPTDLIWKEGMDVWTAAEKVPEVTPAAAPPAPAAVPETPASGAGDAPAETVTSGPSTVAVAPGPPTSGLAIASMVLGIIGLISCYVHGVFALPAVICGHMASSRIKKAPGEIGGRGMAIAGIVMGYIGLFLQVLTIGFILMFFTKASTIQEQMHEQMNEEVHEQLQEAVERQGTQF